MKADQENIGNYKLQLYLFTSLRLMHICPKEVNRELTSIERNQVQSVFHTFVVQSVFHTFVVGVMSDDVVPCVARATQRNIERIRQNFKKEAL